MAERKKNKQDYIGDEPIADYIARLGANTLKDPAVSNTLGFQKAVGAKKDPSFLGELWDTLSNAKPPDLPSVDWAKIKRFFERRKLSDVISEKKKQGTY